MFKGVYPLNECSHFARFSFYFSTSKYSCLDITSVDDKWLHSLAAVTPVKYASNFARVFSRRWRSRYDIANSCDLIHKALSPWNYEPAGNIEPPGCQLCNLSRPKVLFIVTLYLYTSHKCLFSLVVGDGLVPIWCPYMMTQTDRCISRMYSVTNILTGKLTNEVYPLSNLHPHQQTGWPKNVHGKPVYCPHYIVEYLARLLWLTNPTHTIPLLHKKHQISYWRVATSGCFYYHIQSTIAWHFLNPQRVSLSVCLILV